MSTEKSAEIQIYKNFERFVPVSKISNTFYVDRISKFKDYYFVVSTNVDGCKAKSKAKNVPSPFLDINEHENVVIIVPGWYQ